MGKKNVSLKSIASHCNVSIMTVSRALRDAPGVSEEIKSKIRQTAMDFGYMPNHITQSMKQDEKPVIAILVDSFINLYYAAFINELTILARSKNEYDVSFLYFKEFDKEAVKQCILQRVDIIVAHNEPTRETYEFAKLNNVEIVFVGNGSSEYDIDVVSVDNHMGCVLAARYLRNFHSSDKYVYVGVDYFLSEQRYQYFKKELDKLYEDSCDIKFYNAYNEPITTLYSYIVNGYRSLFIYNDMIAYQTLDKLDEIALNIRQAFPDLHLVGFDGLCQYVPGMKQISTIKIDYKKYAAVTYDVIRNRLENASLPKKYKVLSVSLHQRKI